MEDFASAVMMRLVRAGLARQGIHCELEFSGQGPHVPLASKRESVQRILQDHGPMALLRIGEAVGNLADTPVLASFDAAACPLDIVDRWRRLERYVHSRHRTEIVEVSREFIALRHVSQTPNAPPRAAEDLLIFGVIVALIVRVGANGLRARPVGQTDWVFNETWRDAPVVDDCSEWWLEWAGVSRTSTKEAAVGDHASLSALLQADLTRRWTIDDAARCLGLSTRSLQRKLKKQNTSFSQILADSRATKAVRLLERGGLKLGEIGFLCGYADQAHFTRAFKAAIGAPPQRFLSG